MQKVNDEIRAKTRLIQWKNASEVTDWFNDIDDKHHKCFINFDIVEYYPSITKQHLLDALVFAEKFQKIDEEDKNIILNACKTIMFHDNHTWRKKEAEDLFDVPMGSFHGADLVGLYLLHHLSTII